MNLSGVLIIDKPTGITSHDVILKLRRILGIRRVGHSGTLDPGASGVLLVCAGNATKVLQFLSQYDKKYEAVIKLGITTDTYDASGKITGVKNQVKPNPEQIRKAIFSFRGRISQTPPLYSAIKHKGKKLYQYARENEKVEIESREIQIKLIEVLQIKPPLVKFRLTCSKGTYVRSLAFDIGAKLKCGAHLYSLRRTGVGPFGIEEALGLKEVERIQNKGEIKTIMIPLERTLSHLPSMIVKEGFTEKIKNGVSVHQSWIDYTEGHFETSQSVSIKDQDNKVLAIGKALVSSEALLNQEHQGKLFEYTRVI